MQKTKNILLSGMFIFSLFFIILGVVYAESACSNKLTGLNRYSSCQVLTGDTLTVNAEGCTNTCFKISNTSGKSVFIPTNTCAEWDAFLTHMPNGVSTSSCAVAPTISVSDTTKATGDADFTIIYSTNSDGAKTFSSSDTTVATITNTGLVTIVGEGTTTITFNTAATETYFAGTDTATLTVLIPLATDEITGYVSPHTTADCIAAGGVVYQGHDSPVGRNGLHCKFSVNIPGATARANFDDPALSNCPSGWTEYGGWFNNRDDGTITVGPIGCASVCNNCARNVPSSRGYRDNAHWSKFDCDGTWPECNDYTQPYCYAAPSDPWSTCAPGGRGCMLHGTVQGMAGPGCCTGQIVNTALVEVGCL